MRSPTTSESSTQRNSGLSREQGIFSDVEDHSVPRRQELLRKAEKVFQVFANLGIFGGKAIVRHRDACPVRAGLSRRCTDFVTIWKRIRSRTDVVNVCPVGWRRSIPDVTPQPPCDARPTRKC